MEPFSFTWILVLGFIMAFWDSFGIGANDVANAFATSVSSRSLTLRQAVMIACVTEFAGAAILGGAVTSAIKGVVREDSFEERPELLMLVMLASLFGSSSWVIFASSRGWPVSTTHATIGGLSGAALVAFGGEALKWGLDDGVARIVIAWIASPIAAGIIAAIIFGVNKYVVLVHKNSYERARWFVPFWFGASAFIYAHFFIAKAPGLKNMKLELWVAFVAASIAFVVIGGWAMFFYVPWVRRVIAGEDLRWYHVFITPFVGKRDPPEVTVDKMEEGYIDEKAQLEAGASEVAEVAARPKWQRFALQVKDKVLHGVNKDVVNHPDDHTVQGCHAISRQYDNKTESFFSYLQVFTAMANSFAHGSNDVANAIGPLSTIYSIWRTGEFSAKVDTPIWILLYGGIAIDIGLLTYGYHVMRKLGNKITYQTPSRGFATELGASLTVLTASRLKLPVSTTHSLVGATTGVGIISNGSLKAVNWKVLLEAFFSWTVTLPMAGLVAAAVFGFGAYAPSLV